MATVRYTVVNGEVIAEKRGGVRRSYVPDPLGSTVALLDNTQAQTDTFTYWPYGEENSRTGTTATPFRFVGTLGYYRDSSSKSYVRARHLDAEKGRWLTRDPAWPIEPTYGYCFASVVSCVDPSGLRVAQHRPCKDLIGQCLKDLPKDLLDCILKAGGDPEKAKECIRKFPKNIPQKCLNDIANYIGCLAGAAAEELTRPDKDPCKPPEDATCHACCYSKFIACVIKCYKKPGGIWGLCVTACQDSRKGFVECLSTCNE